MKYIITGLIAVILILVVYIYYLNNTQRVAAEENAAYWKEKAFKPDTVYSQTNYKETKLVPDKSAQAIPPKETIIYNNEIPPAFLEVFEKQVKVIDSLTKKGTSISKTFLTQFPKNPKLIGLRSKRDTLSLDLLDIQGTIRTDNYPVDYSVFDYQIHDNQMHATKNFTSNSNNVAKKKVLSYNGTFINYKHDFLQAGHQVEATTGFDIWKIRVGGYLQYPINNNLNPQFPNKLQGGAKLGIRLF